MDEVELMQKVASGDNPAIRMLLDAHYDAIFRLLRHLSGNREDAEDLAQDVFLIVRTKGSSFGGHASIRTWLTRISVNAHAKYRRRERLRQICHLSTPKEPATVDTMIDGEWLLGGMAKLSNEQRITLLLHDVHGFSVNEVATITHCPDGTVKARLHYARKKLQRILICPDQEMKG